MIVHNLLIIFPISRPRSQGYVQTCRTLIIKLLNLFMKQMHSASKPHHTKINWELSTARANAIVRILVDNYKVDPLRVEASGHSQFDPVDENSTPEGRAKNRRTEIILSPKLDEMYKLIES